MRKKLNPELLKEELKKFKLLSEYSFYTEEPKEEDDLILGAGLGEADEEPDTVMPSEPNIGDDSKTAANASDSNQAPADTNSEVDPNQPNELGANDEIPDGDISNDNQTQEPDLAPEEPIDTEMPGDDAIEVDVTQLVQGSEEATNAANDASQKTSELLSKFNDLEKRVSTMNTLTQKIDALEKEIVKRNPTPIEKLEMRSMNSYPYNIKLTDYWSDVDGYDATGSEKEEEYILTQDDVDTGFTDSSIKKTFDVPNDYEEEDVY